MDRVTLDVGETEFLTLVGPSGCGKSTLMRLIAGLEDPTSGDIYITDRRVNDIPTRARNVGFIFQGYALFKHMTVAQNISFGLKIKKVPKAKRLHRVEELVALMGLEGLESRHPDRLSGGQQQRVALARALARRPGILLLDEPFGAVDAKVRQQLRADTKRWQRALKIPMILVTHDQREALELGDRVAVMNEGQIEQIDRPRTVYEVPATEFDVTPVVDQFVWLVPYWQRSPMGFCAFQPMSRTLYNFHGGMFVEFRGRRAFAAARQMFAYMFDSIGARKLMTLTPGDNRAAMRFNALAGLRRQGLITEAHMGGGKLLDMVLFGLTVQEFEDGN